MEFNNKKLTRVSKVVNFLISAVLCGFLISLSAKVIGDIDDWKEMPDISEFKNLDLIESNDLMIMDINIQIDSLKNIEHSLDNKIDVANHDYHSSKKSFDNWLKTRVVTGSSAQDTEVLKKTKTLDSYFEIEKGLREELNVLLVKIQDLRSKIDDFQDSNRAESNRAFELQQEERKTYILHVFLIRLLIVMPILGLGIFFVLKFRKHKFWPLFRGFVLFAFYAFFVGLLPYLPDYGGYIRYATGIVLSVFFGIYVLNKIRAFIQKKKNELKKSSTERSKVVKSDTAEKALDNHMCPSCGKDFIVVGWQKMDGGKKLHHAPVKITSYCRFCGLQLFKACDNCETVNFVHLPFCSNCGDKVSIK